MKSLARLIRPSIIWPSIGTLALVALFEAWEPLTGTRMTARLALVLLGLYNVARIGWGVERRLTAPHEPPQKRKFVDRPGEILKLGRRLDYTAIGKLTPYLGQWIALSGKFEGTAETLTRDAIHMSLLLPDRERINLRFTPAHASELRELKTGQRVDVIGQIACQGPTLMPENCELVERALRAA